MKLTSKVLHRIHIDLYVNFMQDVDVMYMEMYM